MDFERLGAFFGQSNFTNGLYMQVRRCAGRCGFPRSAKPVEVALLVGAKSVMYPIGNVASGFGNNNLCWNEAIVQRIWIQDHGVGLRHFTGSALIGGFRVCLNCLKVCVVQRNADFPANVRGGMGFVASP